MQEFAGNRRCLSQLREGYHEMLITQTLRQNYRRELDSVEEG